VFGRSFDRWNAVSTVEIGRPRLNLEGHVDGAGRSDAVERVRSVSTGTSGRPEKRPVKGVQRLYLFGMLINTCWPALGEVSRDF
jgi:hypothetical protein